MSLFIFFLVFICIAGGLVWFLLGNDQGEKEPISAIWIALAFGAAGAGLAVFLETNLLHIDLNALHGASLSHIAWTALAVGVVEEACKFLPLAFYIYKKRYFNENTDGVIFFALAGLGFGLPENILYTAQFGSAAGFARLFLTPFFHAATTAFIGYFLAKYKLERRNALWVSVPLVGVMLLHAIYDFGLMSARTPMMILSVAVTFCLSGAFFVLFFKARNRDQDRGLSVVGHNAFCRSCGHPNPKHHLYCTNCGKNA